MPWQETCPVEERLRFVREHQRHDASMAELCREFGISRRTGYKWLSRFEERGRNGLADLRRAPLSHPNATPSDLLDVILELRHEHPTWGPKKLRAWLINRIPNRAWPAPSTFGAILARNGLAQSQRRPRKTPPNEAPLAHADQPNAVWCADFKGWFKTLDGRRCDPLTVSDAFSRYFLCGKAVDRPDAEHVKPALEAAFREYGLPLAFRTDNGTPFASNGLGGLSRLSVWLLRLGVRPERIKPGRPDQNGRHERFHRTMKAETASPPAADLKAQQRAFDRFRREYNEERPHEALAMRTPASIYQASTRPYPRRLRELEYPAAFAVRRVRHSGEIKFAGDCVYVTPAVVGELVGLEQLDERTWRLHLGSIELGIVDTKTKKLCADEAVQTGRVLPMCPV